LAATPPTDNEQLARSEETFRTQGDARREAVLTSGGRWSEKKHNEQRVVPFAP
jgi:hypothetical protein